MNDFSSATKLRSERGRPPFFAGRSAELAALRKRFDDLCETGDATEGLALIVGVPGIGKTQLGRRFVEEVARRSMPEDEAAQVVAAGGDGDALVETAIAHGVLTLDAQGDVGFGFPSFHAYMEDRLERGRRARGRQPYM